MRTQINPSASEDIAELGDKTQLAIVTQSPFLVTALVGACNAALAITLTSDRGAGRGAASALVGAWVALATLGVPTAAAVRPDVSSIIDTQMNDAGSKDVRALIVQPDFPRGERWNSSAPSRPSSAVMRRLTVA